MKIKNLEVGIKIGEKQKTFTNLILNSYLDLFSENILSFQSKNLPFCLVNFTKNNTHVNINSTNMEYDTVLEARFEDNIETISEKSIINKYLYKNAIVEGKELAEFEGQPIKQLGFANYDYIKNEYIVYAYLDISKYNIVIQKGQPVIISRIDKVESDMNFWSNSQNVKGPIHLTGRGLLEYAGMHYGRTIPKLYSIGFGYLPYLLEKEYLFDELEIRKGEVGELIIGKQLENYKNNDLLPSDKLYPNSKLYPQKGTANLLVYKFKLYKEVYEDPEEPPILKDTGIYYCQYQELKRYGIMNLKIKYERG